MGDQDSFLSSNPIYIVAMRNSRGKLFVYVAVLGVLCFVVFLLSNTHTSLKELEGVSEKCQQQRDSLSAQLQVLYEHKNRLEKSLQQEKTDLKNTKEANEKMISELENKFEKEKEYKHKLETQLSQLKTSLSQTEDEKAHSEDSLKEKLKTLQSQKDAEIEKLQTHITELLSEKDKLETSNSAYTWKLEQKAGELDLCQIQLQQAKTEAQACQEHARMLGQNGGGHVDPAIPLVTSAAGKVSALLPSDLEKQQSVKAQTDQLIVAKISPSESNDIIPQPRVVGDIPLNSTSSSPLPEKTPLLQKPHIMRANDLGEGVLPRPSEDKLDGGINNDLEVADGKKEGMMDDPLIGNLANREAEEHLIDKAAPGIENHPLLLDNHPQVAAPNLEERDDHAAERGEDGNQYGNQEAKQQVEVPAVGQQQNPPPQKDFFPILAQDNNDIAQQVNDMMNKSPGEVNQPVEQNVLGAPPHLAAPEHKFPELRNKNAFLHRGADANRIMDDKNYEDDDDDRENDDEPPNGLAPAVKGVNNILPDNDFDDQENVDNAKEEEGVVVAPK